MVGITSALRISDILSLKVKHVWDGKKPVENIELHEKKTGKLKRFPVTPNLNRAIREYMKEYNRDSDSFLFVSRVGRKDRKSTRLNSSHVAISYAVFCLKKKKKQKRL